MSKKILGETFDIHGGGLDLVFPHHENEIAQSECCHAKPMVRYWVHNGLLRAGTAAGKIGGRADRQAGAPADGVAASAAMQPEEAVSGKMSRSKGAGGLADLIQRQGGERIRFFLLRTHYRSTVLFNEPAIEEAGIGLEAFYRLFKRYTRITGQDFYALQPPMSRTDGVPALAGLSDPVLQSAIAAREKFLAAMDDDFNTGGAVGELFELAKITNRYCDEAGLEATGKTNAAAITTFTALLTTLKELSHILGIFIIPPAKPQAAGGGELLAQLMPLVIELRAAARNSKNFAVADKIRDGLDPLHITLEDRPGGTDWSGGGLDATDGLMKLLIQLRTDARAAKNFATADTIRNRLADLGITLEDRPGGTDWTS
jgi:cysteinyl-tRNA synthetase